MFQEPRVHGWHIKKAAKNSDTSILHIQIFWISNISNYIQLIMYPNRNFPLFKWTSSPLIFKSQQLPEEKPIQKNPWVLG